MSIIKTSNFRLLRQGPVDDKTYMTFAESSNLILAEMYPWMEFVDPDDGKRYRLQPKTPADLTNTDYRTNWEFVEDLDSQEGQKGGYTKYIFIRSTDVDGPSTPITIDPTVGEGWSSTPYIGEGVLWLSFAMFDGNNNISGLGWSAPIQVEGSSYTTRFIFAASATKPSITGTDSTNYNITDDGFWFESPPQSSLNIWVSKGVSNEYGLMVAPWSDPIKWTGEAGENATSEVFIFKRSATQPLRPNDELGVDINDPVINTYGNWHYAPYPAAVEGDKLWMCTARFKNDVLVTGWSEAIDIEGDNGYEIDFVFKGSDTKPLRPEGTIPSLDWWFDPDQAVIVVDGRELPIWASKAVFKDGNIQGLWSVPVKWNGLDGEDAYSIFLTNDNHSYHADSNEMQSGDWSGGYSQIRVYKGTTQFQCTDPNIDGINPTVNNTYKVVNIEKLIGDMTYSTHIVSNQLEIRPVSMITKTCVLRLTIIAQSRWVDTTITKYVSYSMVVDGESAWSYHLSNPDFNFIKGEGYVFIDGHGYAEAKSQFVIMIGSERLKYDGLTHALGEPTVNGTYKIKSITPVGITLPNTNFTFDITVVNEQLTIEPTLMNVPIVGLQFVVSVMHKGVIHDIELKQTYKLTSPLAGEWNIYTDKSHYTFIRNEDGSINGDFSSGDITIYVNKGHVGLTCVNTPAPTADTNEFGQLVYTHPDSIHNGPGFSYDVYPNVSQSGGGSPIDFGYAIVLDSDDGRGDSQTKHFRLKPLNFTTSARLTTTVTFMIRVKDVDGKIMMIYRSVTFTIQDLSLASSYKFVSDESSLFVPTAGFDLLSDGRFEITGFFGTHENENPLLYNSLLPEGTWRISSIVADPLNSATFSISGVTNTAILTPTNIDYTFGGKRVIRITVNIEYKDPQGIVHSIIRHLAYNRIMAVADGTDGADGAGAIMVWQRSATKPMAPVGDTHVGWFKNPYDEDNQNKRLWMSLNYKFISGAVVTTWSDPVQVDSLPDQATLMQIIQDSFGTLLAQLTQRVEALEALTGTTHHNQLIDLENRVDQLSAPTT